MTSEEISSQLDPAALNDSERRSTRAAGLRALRVLALAVYGLIFAELFVRIVCPQPLMPRYITGTPWGVRGNIPNARYWHHIAGADIEYRINSQGMRADRDFPVAKPAGTCRIALFGDSFMMGYELDLRDSFATRMEQQLDAAGYRVEVLNFSVSGFGTAEMLRTYTDFARQFDPDIVIFSWHYSDSDDNVRSGLYRLRDGKLEETHATYLPSVSTQDFLMRSRLYRLIADNSQLYSLLRERLGLFLKGIVVQFRWQQLNSQTAPATNDAAPEDDDDEERPAHLKVSSELSSAIVAHAAQTVAADNRDFYLVEIPTRISRTTFRPSIDALSPEVRAQVNVVSPMAAFTAAARPDRKIYFETGHGHLTPFGVNLLEAETQRAVGTSSHLAACRSVTPPHSPVK